jgi:hypothetical protein
VATNYKKPDLNAPRYRPKKLNLTNVDVYNKFIEENSRFSSLTATQFKQVISSFNGKIWQHVIDNRDGVELPEQLGYLFIGTCPRKQNDNPNYKVSNQYGQKVQNQNWESDQYVAKIFYTNFETKYRFKHHEMWGFTGLRDFKRTVAKTYPTEWKKYVQVDNLVKVSLLFRKQKFKDFKKQETARLLDEYDEFNLD